MKLVKCSATIAATRSDDSGSRKVKIWKGTGRETVVTIDRHGVRFPDGDLPPEITADPELIVVDLPSTKPARVAIESAAATEVAALDYAALVEKAKELGVKTHGVKKDHLVAAVTAALADAAKAKAAATPNVPAGDPPAVTRKKGDRVQVTGSEPPEL